MRQRNQSIFRALLYRETVACKITALAGSLFGDGEPTVNGMLMALEREWLNVVEPGPDGWPSVPCLLVFSAQERTLQSEHEAQWIRGVEFMEAVLEQVGAYRGWGGWVNHASYELMKARRENVLKTSWIVRQKRHAKNTVDQSLALRRAAIADQDTPLYTITARPAPPSAISGRYSETRALHTIADVVRLDQFCEH